MCDEKTVQTYVQHYFKSAPDLNRLSLVQCTNVMRMLTDILHIERLPSFYGRFLPGQTYLFGIILYHETVPKVAILTRTYDFYEDTVDFIRTHVLKTSEEQQEFNQLIV